jgi:2-methylisocitrate lyase-like PEP mutase family enzyme
MTLNTKAAALRALHQQLLILPNAWDAASAAAIAAAGAAAVATTSAGVAWSRGVPDGHRLSREDMIEAVRQIVAAVEVPVTADVENGYGESPEDVAETVRQVIAAGAVGINLEDSRTPADPLHTPEEQAARIRAARGSAAEVPDFFINARTDVLFFQKGDLAEVSARAKVYADAGADCLFVPGLLDLAQLKELAAASPLPINAMAGPGSPTPAELGEAGVRRVSLGVALHLAAYASAHRAVSELLNGGTYDAFTDASDVAGAIMRF